MSAPFLPRRKKKQEMNESIKSFSKDGLESLIVKIGLPKFRAGQLLQWLYGKNARSYEEMTNLPKSMREQLEDAYPLHVPVVVAKQESVDGSRKYLLQYHDGTRVETVGLPSSDGRLSVCCSSQAGCAMQCVFCATGKQGLIRNLEPGEIVDQIFAVQDDFNERVTNVVVMGQGEPFANYDSVMAALEILNDKKLLNIGARHITISTCGLVPGIEKLMKEDEQYTLAVSLHSARQNIRDEIMPAVRNYRLGDLRKALDTYAQATGRRFSLEYALMKDVNDGEEDLRSLIQFCKRLLCHVNLIPLNEIEGSEFKPVENHVMKEWKEALEHAGIPASIRKSRGSDIAGACGQLANGI